MKKRSGIIIIMAVCVVGFIGQLAASGATTNSVWDVTSISTLSAGKTKIIATNPATAVFLSDGTCSLLVGTNTFGASYTNTTRLLTLHFSVDQTAALESNAVDFVTAIVPGAAITLKSAKFSKIPLKLGVPVKATETISGLGSEVISGKLRKKGFKFITAWTSWVLSSGVAF